MKITKQYSLLLIFCLCVSQNSSARSSWWPFSKKVANVEMCYNQPSLRMLAQNIASKDSTKAALFVATTFTACLATVGLVYWVGSSCNRELCEDWVQKLLEDYKAERELLDSYTPRTVRAMTQEEALRWYSEGGFKQALKKQILAKLPCEQYPYVIYMERVVEQQKNVVSYAKKYTSSGYPALYANLEKLESLFEVIVAVLAQDQEYRNQLAVVTALRQQREREERELRLDEQRYWYAYHHPCCNGCSCTYWCCDSWRDNYWDKERIERERLRVEKRRLDEERRHNRVQEEQWERDNKRCSSKQENSSIKKESAKPFDLSSESVFPEYDPTTHYQPDFY